ncbi:MAG: hypothetical protein ACRYFS_16175 [Janthinobacterium lividum]
MIAYNTPTHCPSAPGLSWSIGSLSVITDDAVEKWLAKNHPETARTLRTEARIVLDQQRVEMSIERPSMDNTGQAADTLPGTPIAELMDAPKHWACALYPGCGSKEICELVAPLLTAKEGAALRMQFEEGKTGREISQALGSCRSRVFSSLKSARVKLYEAVKADALPAASDCGESLSEIQQLLQASPTVYQRVSHSRRHRRAYVCNCGHHLTLTNADLDHRRVAPKASASQGQTIPERLFRCRFCSKTYTESDWPKIIA